MRLSFRNIIEISNLNNFESLTKLRLDNNIIDRIMNLSHLVHLTWLDLSFNNIRQIEGLDGLSNLTDLSLYHNQIEEIKGLSGCPQLNILSLGHNNILELNQINNLRALKNLRCVCLEGNKVCLEDSYNQHVLAYLTDLKYLDYMLIDKKAVKDALDCHHIDELTDLREREHAHTVKIQQQQAKEAVIQKLKGSFVDCTEDLFEELFSKENETEHLLHLNCYAGLKEDFKEKMSEAIKNLRDWMEEKNDVRTRKVTAFEKAVQMAETEGETEAFQMTRGFRRLKKKVLAQLEREENDTAKVDAMVKHLLDELKKLESQLMAAEISLQEIIEEAISEFEARIQVFVGTMQEKREEFFKVLEDHEKFFHNNLLDGAASEVDQFISNADMMLNEADSVKSKLFSNKDEMSGACNQLSETHQAVTQAKDDYMRDQMFSWMKSFFDGHRDRQYTRNRQRISDVREVIEEAEREIAAVSDTADDDEDAEEVAEQYLPRRR